jgi:hypothetical protein
VNLNYVLEEMNQTIQYVLGMVNALSQINVNVLILQSTLELNVRIQFATTKQWMKLAQIMEIAQLQISVNARKITQDLNVNTQSVLVSIQRTEMFVLEMEIAPNLTIVIATMDTSVKIVL